MATRRHVLQTLSSATLGALLPGGLAHAASVPRSDVVVIGAGLSGLYAAWLLEQKGLVVTVVEGSTRLGGRLYTLDDLPGRPNTGGVEVGNGYRRLLALAANLGIDLVEPPAEGRGAAPQFVIGGQVVLASDWANSPLNALVGAEKPVLPHLLETAALRDKNPFTTLDDWYSPRFAEFDVPFGEFLRKNGSSDEAIRLINANANTNDLATTSTLQVLRSQTVRAKGGSTKTLRIKNGSQRLPEAVARALKTPPRLSHRVTKIEDKGRFVRVQCANGEAFESRLAVVSCPFTALRSVRIEAPLPPVFREAIARLPYTQITQVHFLVKRPFWEDDHLPASIWSDGMLGRFFTEKNPVSGHTTAVCWLNGTEALAADKLPPSELSALVLAELKRIRPASEGALEVATVNSWGNNPFAGGAYHHLAPGQASRFFPTLTQNTRSLHFCGEHLALHATGMEGALESAERVVQAILVQ